MSNSSNMNNVKNKEDDILLNYEKYIYEYINDSITISKLIVEILVEPYNDIKKLNNYTTNDLNIINYEFSNNIYYLLLKNYDTLVNLNSQLNNDKSSYNLFENIIKFISRKSEEDAFKQKKIKKFKFFNIIKTNNKNDLINIYLAYKFFNKLKKFIPTFGYVYLYMQIIHNKNDSYMILNKHVDHKIKINNNKQDGKLNPNDNLSYYVIDENYSNFDLSYKEIIDFDNILKKLAEIDINKLNDKNNLLEYTDIIYLNVIIQIYSIIIFIKKYIIYNNYNEDDIQLILNFNIHNIYLMKINNKYEYNMPIYTYKNDRNNKKEYIKQYYKTKYIIYIPIIANDILRYNDGNESDSQNKKNIYTLNNFIINFVTKFNENVNNNNMDKNIYITNLCKILKNNNDNNLINKNEDNIELTKQRNMQVVNDIKNDKNINNNSIEKYNDIYSYENYIYKYMDKIPIFKKYNIFTIKNLNKIAKNDNNFLKYNFNYEVSQILITYQKDISYGNKPSLLDNLNIFNNIKNFLSDDYNKKYNLNTNNLKYLLTSKNKNKENIEIRDYKNYKILKLDFMNVITTNSNDPKINYELIKNVYLGFKYFNDLKKYFPTFGYVYCYMKCTNIINNLKDNFNNWCYKTDNTKNLVPYFITDNYIEKYININNKEYNNGNIYYYDIIRKYTEFIDKDMKILNNINLVIILQLISIFNYIRIYILKKVNENDKNLILNFNINIYYFNFEENNKYEIPILNNNGEYIKKLKTNYIVYIPILNFLENNVDIYYNLSEFIDECNKITNEDINNLLASVEMSDLGDPHKKDLSEIYNKSHNNLLNKYYYNLSLEEDYKKDNEDKSYGIFENKKSIFNNFFGKYANNDIENEYIIDIKLTKFVSEYCLNDLKYMNNFNSAKKKVLEEVFIKLINKKINKLNGEMKNEKINLLTIYNKYVKFIDTLVKAKCLDYKVKLYDIFKFKINLAEKIYKSNMDNNQKDNMFYTIEESYKNLPNSNLFLNFIFKTPIIDIIINAFIFYLFIYSVFYLFYFINSNGINIIEKSILKNYITIENLEDVKKILNYSIKIVPNLVTNYKSNIIVNLYIKLYENNFINIPLIFDKFKFILPIVLSILFGLNITNFYSSIIFNNIINAINNKLFGNIFLRFKINNLLSPNFPSMIYFMWEQISSNDDKNKIINEN